MASTPPPSRLHRWPDLLSIGLTVLALVGYFGPWLRQRAAGLAWNAYDSFDLLRYLPQIEAGALRIDLQQLRLPLLGLGVGLPLLVATARPGWRWTAAAVGIILSAATLPPYPQLLTAWRTPGWDRVLWWGVGSLAAILLITVWGPRWGRWSSWLALLWLGSTGLPALWLWPRLLPALSALHQAPQQPGWGYWLYGLSWAGLVFSTTWKGWHNREVTMSEDLYRRIRRVKQRHEAMLLRKANVVGVGIGLRHCGGQPTTEPVLVVSVTHKVPLAELPPQDRIPRELDGVPVDVQAIGTPRAE